MGGQHHASPYLPHKLVLISMPEASRECASLLLGQTEHEQCVGRTLTTEPTQLLRIAHQTFPNL